MKKAFSLLVAVVALLVPAAAQATVSADVPVGDPILGTNGASVSLVVGVAEPIVLTAVGASCASSCYSWRDPDSGLIRYGGVTLGYGPVLTVTSSVVGSSRVTLRYCVKTSIRFVRCATTFVYITTV